MGLGSSIIETGVDRLVNLVNKKGRISSSEAAIALGVSSTVIMEWADFLEEEGIINIEYKFTKQFLVARKLAKKDLTEKAKEFSGKRDVFIRKAETSLSFLERESKKLKSIKDEFDEIKKELGFDIGHIRDEFEELKKCEQLKINLDNQIEGQKTAAMERLEQITKQILVENKKYQTILEDIKKEEKALEKDKKKANSLEESEELIKERLNSLRELIKKVDRKSKTEERNIEVSERNIERLNLLAESTRVSIEKGKSLIDPLVEESKYQTEKIKQLQGAIINKIKDKEKKLKGAKTASKKIEALFKKKMGVLNLIEKVNKDRTDLQNELIELIKKAKSFQLSSKGADTGKEITDIENKFKEVDAKKRLFETELKKVGHFLK